MPFRDGYTAQPSEIRVCNEITASIQDQTPYALSALGFSGQALLLLPGLSRGKTDAFERAVELTLLQHTERQSGLFFTSRDALRRYASSFQASIRSMDALAVAPGTWVEQLTPSLAAHSVVCPLDAIDSRGVGAHHPLQSILDSLADQRVLLVSTPATFLAGRANSQTFEGVWASCGRKWFNPASIRAQNIPNTYAAAVREQFTDSNHLLRHVIDSIPEDEFDVALIGAALYGPPLAAHIRSMGKVAISLGSQLQLLFGVYGRRWTKWPDFVAETLNESWTLFPSTYAPPDDLYGGDDRSYWG